MEETESGNARIADARTRETVEPAEGQGEHGSGRRLGSGGEGADNPRKADTPLTWDPAKYQAYADLRDRPFFDLTARVGAEAPRRVVDLGCGSGHLTAALAGRWPDAEVIGLDSSPEMIEQARGLDGAPGNLRFDLAAIEDWMPDAATDVVVSNAALQWVPGHTELLSTWAAALAPGAWLAFQIPGNFDAPSHALMRALADSERWRPKLDGVLRHADAVAPLSDYLDLLLSAGWEADAWATAYQQVLQGEDPVLEWVRGTGFRPVMQALDAADLAEFEASYSAALRAAYPRRAWGTLFPFRRLFVVGHKPEQRRDT
ncbi:Trans-aconitate 2-methyltransferase [Arthrobacter saudimassiliensis]|uniref:Trans-aconitate 2-methyltransferase n=1 Tax=Arthrobacter saudimassiliensis TaxID=1461584 RepID=A0A078MRM9_9MICC|nr:Trans-aconitate 2-methyltransferase [Arthrobacter saudimassiliensis]